MAMTKENVEMIHGYMEAMSDLHLEELIKIASQPSVSAQNVGVEECCAMLMELFTRIGMKAQILESPTKPAVFAELRSKQENVPTILFYGYYDVQPAEPLELWNTQPFRPTVLGGKLYGRGVADNKGQFMAHVMAVQSYMDVLGDVPVNVKFILDGEEESGSPSLPWIAEHNRELLQADLMYVSDGSMYSDTIPQITYGNRGVLSFDIDITTAQTDNHSGNKGGVIENAAWKMVKLLSSMVDEEGNATIEGFYDTITPISPAQQKMIEELEFDPETLSKLYGVDKLKYEDKLIRNQSKLV